MCIKNVQNEINAWKYIINCFTLYCFNGVTWVRTKAKKMEGKERKTDEQKEWRKSIFKSFVSVCWSINLKSTLCSKGRQNNSLEFTFNISNFECENGRSEQSFKITITPTIHQSNFHGKQKEIMFCSKCTTETRENHENRWNCIRIQCGSRSLLVVRFHLRKRIQT